MTATGRSIGEVTTITARLAAYGAIALLASGLVAVISTVLLVLTFATQASTMMEPVTEMTPLDRAANGLMGLSLLVAIPAAFRLHQSWRNRAAGASTAALAVGVASLLGYGLLQLVLAGAFFRPADVGVISIVPLGGIGVWILLVCLGRADPALTGVPRWLGVAVGVGNVLLLLGFYGGGGAAAIADPTVVLESPLLLVSVMASLLALAIGYPIWAIWLGRRWRGGR